MQESEFCNYFNYRSVLFQCENGGELQCKIQFQFHGSNFKVIRQSSDRHQTVYIPQIYFESIKQFSHYVIHRLIDSSHRTETSKFSLKFIFSENAIKFEKFFHLSLDFNATKAELLHVGLFFPHPFICMRNFITKTGENRRNSDHLVCIQLLKLI